MSEDPLLTTVSMVSLVATAVFAATGVMVTRVWGKKLSQVDKMVLTWLVFNILIHLLLEGPFVVISLTGTVLESDHFLALTWKEYAKADLRWGVSDPTIVSLEILTVTIVELAAVVLVYAILKNKYYRHFCQIVVCVCELYGGWITFCPEWLTGSPNLRVDNFLFLWVYLVFFNMLWVVMPLGLLWQSWGALKVALSDLDGEILTVKKETIVTTNTVKTYNTRSKSKKAE